MITLHPSSGRGHANHGWLDSRFSFSFADFYDPARMGFRALRVINEDHVAPGAGFPKHPHRDMEILTYVLEGSVRHEDSTGAAETLIPGELQHMSAGSGVRHSEMNPSGAQPLHLLQIWLIPNQLGIPPRYEQKQFPIHDQPNKLHLLASTDARNGSFQLHSDAELSASRLEPGATVTHTFRFPNAWLQVARGRITANGKDLQAGDALQLESESDLTVSSDTGGEFLLFDLA